MNKLIEAKLWTKGGNIVNIYRHNETQTGVHMAPHQPTIYNVDVEAFYYAMQKMGYKVAETTRQIKERELGNSDEAYEVTKFEHGLVVVQMK